MRSVRFSHLLARWLFAAGGLVLAGVPAQAHPHVWVTMKTDVLFDGTGKISALRQAWTFDEEYSAFSVQGIGQPGKAPTREDLDPLAKINVESLNEFSYFTFGKAAGRAVAFASPRDYWLDQEADKRLTLHFTLPLAQPASASRNFSFQVYDPTFFVDFEMEPDAKVALVSAPSGCSTNVNGPPALAAADVKAKDESFFSGLSPGTDFGIKLAARVIVACP